MLQLSTAQRICSFKHPCPVVSTVKRASRLDASPFIIIISWFTVRVNASEQAQCTHLFVHLMRCVHALLHACVPLRRLASRGLATVLPASTHVGDILPASTSPRQTGVNPPRQQPTDSEAGCDIRGDTMTTTKPSPLSQQQWVHQWM